ncbi:MAG: hypothetical protein IPI25_14625 [Candidatus Brocadia sp.]|nr:MAG: hypothetical protein IPI25_14625 [Candidatus Brocadia sp.]
MAVIILHLDGRMGECIYYLQHMASFGWFVRAACTISASSAMMAVAPAYMFQVFIFGAHKKTREPNWIA